MPFKIGPWELILILAIVLIIFGGRRIPEIARGLGEGIRNFRDSMRGGGEKPPGGNASEEKK